MASRSRLKTILSAENQSQIGRRMICYLRHWHNTALFCYVAIRLLNCTSQFPEELVLTF